MQQISNDVDFDTRIAEAAGKSKKELIELRKEVAKTALALADANYDKVLEQHSQGKATKEQLEKARENSLSAWDNYNKTMQDAIVADYEERTERKKKKDTADQTIDAISDAEVKARRKIEAMRIELMRDGAQKEKAEARKRLDDELTRIDAEERERIAALVKAKKNGIPVTKEQADTVTEQAKAQREGATNIYIKEFSEIEKKYTRQEKELWDEANAVFRSALENRLADIDRHYDEQIKKAEGNQALIDALNTSREKEKDTEKNIAKLEILDNAEQVELQRQAIVMQGLALDELAEVQRNNIIIRYARERIKILKTLGGERNKQEAAQLENMTKGLEKQNARRSLAGLFNEKTFKAVQGHFQKIYKDSDKAKEKTVSLFESIQKGGRLGAEGIGMLKSVFGGLDEDMDKALEAAGNIASGFAQGGIVGGALAAAGELVNFIAGGCRQTNDTRKP
ncbi:alpha-1,2-mannosidase [Bacteroides pyogenes JCM 10003]|nr:alpha-1,2-mannosidase [Bacteroides pyogenes JCM 10003]